MLEEIALAGASQHIFIPRSAARLMRLSGQFAWLPKKPIEHIGALDVLYRDENKSVYSHLHFSVYGKFETRKVNEAATIGSLIETIS